MFEESLSFTLSLLIDFVDADFFVPGCHSKVFADRRKAKVRDTVFWWRGQGDIFRDISSGIGLARCRRRGADGTEERHSKGASSLSSRWSNLLLDVSDEKNFLQISRRG